MENDVAVKSRKSVNLNSGDLRMIKKVGIEIGGSECRVLDGFIVTPETTTNELLTRANLSEYELCPSSSELPFGNNEEIFEKVGDNSVLYAFRNADAGGNTPASNTRRSLLDLRGWKKEDLYYRGYYRTRFGSFQGKIRERTFSCGDFYIHNPPEVLKDHIHWSCFIEKSEGWYSLHFDEEPASLSEGVKSIECLIIEAFKNSVEEA